MKGAISLKPVLFPVDLPDTNFRYLTYGICMRFRRRPIMKASNREKNSKTALCTLSILKVFYDSYSETWHTSTSVD